MQTLCEWADCDSRQTPIVVTVKDALETRRRRFCCMEHLAAWALSRVTDWCQTRQQQAELETLVREVAANEHRPHSTGLLTEKKGGIKVVKKRVL